MTRVGFIGIGRMGLPMARNLFAAGYPLTVWNRTTERCRPLAETGADVAASPAEATREADIVVTMVADAEAASAVLLGADGALGALARGGIAVDMSTIGPKAARALAGAASERGAFFLDAPVSGSVVAAESAQLTTMVGGDRDAFERARPVLAAMTKAQLHLGPSGAGAAMKLALNAVVALTNQALAECLVLAERAGIPRGSAYDVLEGSVVGSPFVGYKRAAFLDPDAVAPVFTTALMQKDLGLALELARELRAPMPATAAACETLSLAAALGHAEADFARVADALRITA